MGTPDHAKARAIGAYNAAADHYDDPANAFWDRFGRRTVERHRLGLDHLECRAGDLLAWGPPDNSRSPRGALACSSRRTRTFGTRFANTGPIGSGYRGTIEQLDAKSRERIRRDNLAQLRDEGVRSLEANVIFARATKGGDTVS
jgi:hypothetical protein